MVTGMSLPVEIKQLMVSTVQWEPFNGFDGHGQPTFKPPQNVNCYAEHHGFMDTGLEISRKATTNVSDPDFDLYFSGDDPNALTFTIYDRFFIPFAVSATSKNIVSQPSGINTVPGPWGGVWLIVVWF